MNDFVMDDAGAAPITSGNNNAEFTSTRWSMQRVAPICLLLLSLSAAARVACYRQLLDSPLAYQHRWDQSDMHFYDQWARDIAAGDWMRTRTASAACLAYGHGAVYLAQHPGAADRSNWLEPGVASPEHKLWDDWYGQKRFHQEPLYPYLVAATYRLWGDDVRHVFAWQLLLGCATNVLIYLLRANYLAKSRR